MVDFNTVLKMVHSFRENEEKLKILKEKDFDMRKKMEAEMLQIDATQKEIEECILESSIV